MTAGGATRPEGPVKRRVTVLNEPGLHARPAVVLAERARQFAAAVALVGVTGTVEVGQRVDAKNVVPREGSLKSGLPSTWRRLFPIVPLPSAHPDLHRGHLAGRPSGKPDYFQAQEPPWL